MRTRWRREISVVMIAVLCLGLIPFSASASEDSSAVTASAQGEYTLEQVVVLSRHNIRSPLSERGSVLDEITPHEWFTWTSKPAELSLRGAMLETTMGQYFRLWLEKEGLFPENYIPEDGAVRFYANGLQRTQATARYFSAGLLPVAVVPVERHVAYNEMDEVFMPVIHFLNEDYAADAAEEIAQRGGGDGLSGYSASLEPSIRLLMEVTDMEESEAYQSGAYGDLLEDETKLFLWEGDVPALIGPIKTVLPVADALVLQYYEEPDDLKAAFGHELSFDDWRAIGRVLAVYEEIVFASPLLAANMANPMLRELYAELNTPGRRFSFLCGHDSTLSSVLGALGVQAYELPGAIETATPIGAKLVFERWVNRDGASFFKVEMIYQSAGQLRSMQMLSLDTPPMIVPLAFEGIEVNEDGMIAEENFLKLFRKKIDMPARLEEEYTAAAFEDAA